MVGGLNGKFNGGSEKSCNFRHDLVRSERYFTATLLPLLLFHNNLEGARRFVNLVDNKAKSERDSFGKPIREKGTPEYNDFKDAEVNTEFHIARDLEFAGLLEANIAPSEEGKAKRDAPDVVIAAGRELVVCEGKFFDGFNTKDLNEQLCSQPRA